MTAKKRVSNYLKFKGISQYEFSRRTKLSNGYLNSGDNVTSANLDAITTAFRDLNLLWVVKGIGPMIIPEESIQLTYSVDGTENKHALLKEDIIAWLNEESDEKLANMTPEQLINSNKYLKILIRSKSETIQAKDELIVKLEQLITEKDNSSRLKDKLIAQLQQNSTKE